MKYLLFILTLTLSIQCTAQNQIVNATDCNTYFDKFSGDYYRKDVNNILNQYEGIWKWTEGNKEFILTLIKQKHHFNNHINYNYYKDRLVGYYEYKENGVIIADTSSDDLNKDFDSKVIFTLTCHSNIVASSFSDYKKNKDYVVALNKLSPTQIKFDGKESVDEIISKSGPGIHMYYSGNTFPLQMVLTKQ